MELQMFGIKTGNAARFSNLNATLIFNLTRQEKNKDTSYVIFLYKNVKLIKLYLN